MKGEGSSTEGWSKPSLHPTLSPLSRSRPTCATAAAQQLPRRPSPSPPPLSAPVQMAQQVVRGPGCNPGCQTRRSFAQRDLKEQTARVPSSPPRKTPIIIVSKLIQGSDKVLISLISWISFLAGSYQVICPRGLSHTTTAHPGLRNRSSKLRRLARQLG